ncbi:MAG: 50S ribosomal protein L6 [Dehalococcoidia bacterium]|nr:50S ribosomal protein L6 [Dehalococcoidia bacterium]
MSRVGKKPVTIPKEVEVKIEGSKITVKGPKGALSCSVQPAMSIEVDGSILTVSRPSDSKEHRSYHGLTRTLIDNMVQGVSQGFQKNLELVGVGYRVQAAEGKLMLYLGYPKPIEFMSPPGISLTAQGTNKITVSGIDKELVGRTSAQIRGLKPPDHYKGKGVRYSGEYVRLKAGKAGKIGGKK